MFKKVAIVILLLFFVCTNASPTRSAPERKVGRPRTLSVAAAAFRPDQDGYTFQNLGYMVLHNSFNGSCSGCTSYYYAPVHLPHGAVITGMTALLYDPDAVKSATLYLIETNLATGSVSSWIASVATPAGTNGGFTPYSINGLSNEVDNQTHAYYLRLTVPQETTLANQIILSMVQIFYYDYPPTSTDYFSLTAADFTPFQPDYDYSNYGAGLEDHGTTERDYQAAVYLPHGAALNRLTFYYHGSTSASVSANLAKSHNIADDFIYLAGVSSPLVAADGSGFSATFGDDQIDNLNYTYWVYYRLRSGPEPYGVSIEYTHKIYSSDESYFSVPVAAFIPQIEDFIYENQGKLLVHKSPGYGYYVAPFSPPPGVAVTFLQYNVGSSVNCYPGDGDMLSVNTPGVSLNLLWRAVTLSTGGWYGVESNLLGNAIDYSHYAYFLKLAIPAYTPDNWVKPMGISGKWSYLLFLPTALKH